MSIREAGSVRDLRTKKSAEDQSRTGDTRIFSPLLYLLSYLGAANNLPYAGAFVNVRHEGRRGTATSHELPGFTSGTPSAQSGHSSAA